MKRMLVAVPALLLWLECFGGRSLAVEDHTQSDHKQNATSVAVETNPFGPYEFLIGEWDVKSEVDGSPMAVQRVRWGPNRSYIWYAVALLADGREEPHLEGMLVWNGVHKNLDMLFVMDLRSGRVQEQGMISVEADGSLIRNITAVYSPGVQTITGISGRLAPQRNFARLTSGLDPTKSKRRQCAKPSTAGWRLFREAIAC